MVSPFTKLNYHRLKYWRAERAAGGTIAARMIIRPYTRDFAAGMPLLREYSCLAKIDAKHQGITFIAGTFYAFIAQLSGQWQN